MNEINMIHKIDSVYNIANRDTFVIKLNELFKFDSIYIFEPYSSTEAYKKFNCGYKNSNQFDDDSWCLIVLKFQNNLIYSEVRRKYDFTNIKGFYSNSILPILAIKNDSLNGMYDLEFIHHSTINTSDVVPDIVFKNQKDKIFFYSENAIIDTIKINFKDTVIAYLTYNKYSFFKINKNKNAFQDYFIRYDNGDILALIDNIEVPLFQRNKNCIFSKINKICLHEIIDNKNEQVFRYYFLCPISHCDGYYFDISKENGFIKFGILTNASSLYNLK